MRGPVNGCMRARVHVDSQRVAWARDNGAELPTCVDGLWGRSYWFGQYTTQNEGCTHTRAKVGRWSSIVLGGVLHQCYVSKGFEPGVNAGVQNDRWFVPDGSRNLDTVCTECRFEVV